jgi:hypothetical protein
MLGNLARIPETVRLALLRDPARITAVLYEDHDAEPPRPGFFARLFGRGARTSMPTPADARLPSVSNIDTLDIDKAWHGLHYLLTGDAWEGDFPQGFLVSCGQEVGDVDVGYGPARAFSAAQVKQIAAFLDGLDRGALRGRFDLDAMAKADIYPDIWMSGESADDLWQYVGGALDEVASFVRNTADRDMALLVYLN